ncbi:hypothetical protein D2V93_08510 [Flagellimonas taeanensis]|uniref:hypothetical protein n=1 Tax=Flagellimonas taeanensis TaxID=1005926 RepID=UPI000E69A782|nr:hypothetical protein [Allomuricauda taeanensis]RIV50903.1 hypothetical protein D2V93_08510 [Allomuricauda taeanensis]
MEKDTDGLNSFAGERSKDKQFIVSNLRKKIEKGCGMSIAQLWKEQPEDKIFYLAAYAVTTTKKAICLASGVPVEAACRYKRDLEKSGLLKQSEKDVLCPVTGHPARLISTNPSEFRRLENSNQLKLFPTPKIHGNG